ncbi:MAG TPA: hypothetical protein VFU48_12020 [Nitrospira sp.]|nr:hypothetical protein [Nitrospira sp.]
MGRTKIVKMRFDMDTSMTPPHISAWINPDDGRTAEDEGIRRFISLLLCWA